MALVSTIATADTIGSWTFDEGGGVVVFDDGPGAYHATFGPGAARAEGTYGGAVCLDGTPRAIVTLPVPAGKQFGRDSFTIRCWLCPTRLDIDSKYRIRRLFTFHAWPKMHVYIDVESSGNIIAWIGHQPDGQPKRGCRLISKGQARRDEWTHAVVVCDREAGKLRLYIDGVLDSEGALSPGFDADLTLESPMFLGSTWQSFEGLIGEFSLTRAATDASQAKASYAASQSLYAAALPAAAPTPVRNTTQPTAFFVSPRGNDSWSGTGADPNAAGTDGPFRTVARAAAIVGPGDTCSFRAGVYREVLRPIRSGRPDAPITFRNHDGESAVFSGTRLVTDWRKEEDGLYSAAMPWSMGHMNQFFADGEMLTEARWPDNTGTLLQPTRATVAGGSVNTITDPNVPGDEDFWKGAWVWCAGGSSWHCWCRKVTAFDAATKTLTFEPAFTPADRWYIPRKGNHYVLMGTRNALDAEGEWWLSAAERRVYLKPPGGRDPNGMSVEAKQHLSVIDLSDRSHIRLFGLAFRGGGLMTNKASSHLLLDGLKGEYTGHSYRHDVNANGSVAINGKRIDIINCEFAHSSTTLLRLDGEDCRVANCYVHDGDYAGQWAGTVRLRGRRHIVTRNTFRHSGRDLISTSGLAESIVEYNDLSHAGWLTHDLGMTYGHTTDFMNTVFRYNLVHDNMADNCAMGIYFDHLSMNVIVHHNLIWNVGRDPVRFNNPSYFCLSYHNSAWKVGQTGTFDHSRRNDLFGSRFHNNILCDKVKLPAHVVVRGNVVSDDPGFVDPENRDFRLKSDAVGVDAGVPIPGFNDGWAGNAPAAGALEHGERVWATGHNFDSPPPIPEWAPVNVPFMNGVFNSCFEFGLEGWDLTGQRKAKTVRGNGWGNGYGRGEVEPTGTCHGELELGPGTDGVQQTLAGLFPNTCYTLSGWLKVCNDGEIAELGVGAFGGAEPELSQQVRSATWTRRTVEFKTGPETRSAVVFVRKTSDGPGRVRGDNLGIPRVPAGSDWERPPPEPVVKRAPALPMPAPFRVKRAAHPITIDGRIASDEWPGTEMALLQQPGRTRIKGAPCTARLCQRDGVLHVAVTIPVRKADALKRGSSWGKDDGIEVCFVDAKGASPAYSFALHGFCGGATESVTDGGAPADAAARLGQAARFAATISGDSWTGEWAIPLAAAEIAALPGMPLAFNLCIHRSESNEWILWAGTLGPAWQLANAGTIVLE